MVVAGQGASQDTGAALRKAFLRLPRSAQGTTTLGEAAKGLRGMGVRVDESELTALAVLAGVQAKPGQSSSKPGPSNVDLSTRVDFPTFAAMLDPVELRATSLRLETEHGVRQRSHGEGGTQGRVQSSGNSADSTSGAPGSVPSGSASIGGASTLAQSAVEAVLAQSASARAARAAAGSGLQHPDPIVRRACQRVAGRLEEIEPVPSRAFLRLDAQRDGLLTKDEVLEGLDSMGVLVPQEDREPLLRALDKTDSGLVDCKTFVKTLFPPGVDPFATVHVLPAGDHGALGRGKRRPNAMVMSSYTRGAVGSEELQAEKASAGMALRAPGSALDPDALSSAEAAAVVEVVKRMGVEEDADGAGHIDEDGVFVGARERQRDRSGAVTAQAQRKRDFGQAAPYLPVRKPEDARQDGTAGSKDAVPPRDTWGSPAPFLAKGQQADGGQARGRTGPS